MGRTRTIIVHVPLRRLHTAAAYVCVAGWLSMAGHLLESIYSCSCISCPSPYNSLSPCVVSHGINMYVSHRTRESLSQELSESIKVILVLLHMHYRSITCHYF